MVSVRSLVPVLAFCLLVPATVRADVSTGPKVALHVKAVTSKSSTICTTWQPKTTPCSQYVNKADLFQDQLVYLITTDVSADDGVAGVVCGIDYNQAAGSGVDVVQWTLCADGLQFPNAGPYGEWPMAGGGNVITWLTCQRDTLTTAPQEGVHAIVGAFSVYAYSGDTFSVTANRNLQSGPHLVIGTCKGVEIELQENVAARVAFSPAAAEDGCNPCLSDCGGSFCRITPSSLFFGEVVVGSSRVQSFVIQNTSAAGGSPLIGNIQASCPDFRILSGGGPFNLAPGQSTTVTVEFAPTVGGPLQCSVATGTTCGTVLLSGIGISDPPAAIIEPTTLDATLKTGELKTYTFHLANQGVSNLYWSARIETGIGVAALLSNTTTPKDLTGLRVQWDVGHGQSQTPPDSIVADLIARGATVAIKSGPFTPERLAQCDVLWMSPAWISLTGPEVNALGQWVHLGGSLFLEGIGGYPYNFDFIMQALSSPLQTAIGAYMSGDTQDIGPHAITQDVHRLSLETQYSITGILLPTFELFRGPGGRSVGCAFQSQLGHVVATATQPSLLVSRGDNRLFMNQAFDWLTASGKVTVSPTNGIVPPAQVKDLILTIDADGLQEGDYEITLALLTNDIVHPELEVPIRFHVEGVPELVGIPTQIIFPPIFLGATRAETLEVANHGSGLLRMTAAISGQFSVAPTSLELAPFAEGTVIVSFQPTQLGDAENTLVVTSNDPQAERLEVPVRGSALAPPVLRFSPGSLSDELMLGEEREQLLTLKNAGEYDLVWSARETAFDSEPPLLSHTFGPLTTAAHPPEGERDRAPVPPPSSSALGTVALADLTGKRILRDVRHGQSRYGWTTFTTDLEARGAEITYNSAIITPEVLRDHHVFWTADIWYPFLPSEVTALRDWVLAGGALFIEGDETVYEYNQLLSSVGSGITYVSHSPFNGVTNRLYPHETTEGVNAIYVDYALSVLPTTAPGQKLLESIPGETIGAAARVGQGRVVAVSDELFYDYLFGSQDNRLFGNQIMDWLAEGRLLGIEPEEGIVPGGSSVRISVTLSAKRLLGGLHRGGLVLNTNDPVAENVTLPVTIR
ncbi:MAG TPA: DUF4350 domain-containing protein, partial [Candidatus Eisenbacteria bacterium]|nr:DUF4350 domain-containing protein [Candidatus Eisenbacteria bacterium]